MQIFDDPAAYERIALHNKQAVEKYTSDTLRGKIQLLLQRYHEAQ